MASDRPCRGRFAPSPSGPLHFGSLVAAVGSFLQAKARGGEWLVRIEDIDPPRAVPGVADDILHALEAFGLHWDGPVTYQSHRSMSYLAALEELRHMGTIYACACTRKEIADSSVAGIEGPVYPGTCRDGLPANRTSWALRVRTDNSEIEFNDVWQGRISRRLKTDYGDFVVKRADGLFAYQLAVVVDDAEQGITEVVRGADLLESTPRQIHLQRLLHLPTPRYAHLPVAVNAQGEKLSKQTFAAPVSRKNPLPTLVRALDFLGQQPPVELLEGEIESLWRWAVRHWQPDAVPRVGAIVLAGEPLCP
jgi:glutamyl-Q tRNA(Asp) synthetase